MVRHQYINMNGTKVKSGIRSARIQRITANIPAELLNEATQMTKKGITETLIKGLELIRRSRAAKLAKTLKGNLQIQVDLDISRERSHH